MEIERNSNEGEIRTEANKVVNQQSVTGDDANFKQPLARRERILQRRTEGHDLVGTSPSESAGVPGVKTQDKDDTLVHKNLKQLNERREAVWVEMNSFLENSENVYKKRVAGVKAAEAAMHKIIQNSAQATLTELQKRRETLLENIAPKLQKFESVNNACISEMKTLNNMQNLLRETLEKVEFNI